MTSKAELEKQKKWLKENLVGKDWSINDRLQPIC